MDLWGTLASGTSTPRPGHPQKYCSFGSITWIVEDWKCNGIPVFLFVLCLVYVLFNSNWHKLCSYQSYISIKLILVYIYITYIVLWLK